ncbi:MAG: nicotinamide mononucleotide transporter [Paludibacteraceae bacterium]|nr:nicotinamide mononucleotide transporter [Paludibacteraceae bacterium]
MDTRALWKATGLNFLVSSGLFALLFALLWIAERLFPGLTLLHFSDPAWCVGIPASIIGVCYVLTIRNPQNYTGFYPGILMSALLGIQFLLQRQYDSTALYFCVFIPFQVMSILAWKRPRKEDTPFAPAFLERRPMLLSLLLAVLIVAGDYMLMTFAVCHDTLADQIVLKLCNGLLIASSLLANFWLIYRKNDAWLYWVLYSLSGIALFSLLGNAFSIVLFCFFLVINGMAGIAWIRNTPKENYGWLKF